MNTYTIHILYIHYIYIHSINTSITMPTHQNSGADMKRAFDLPEPRAGNTRETCLLQQLQTVQHVRSFV